MTDYILSFRILRPQRTEFKALLEAVHPIPITLKITAIRPRLLHRMQGPPLNALEGAAELIGAGSSLWAGAELLVQTPTSVAQVQGGRVTGFWSGGNHVALQPAPPLTNAVVAVPRGQVVVRCAPKQRRHPIRLLASCNGAFLVDQEVIHFSKGCVWRPAANWGVPGIAGLPCPCQIEAGNALFC